MPPVAGASRQLPSSIVAREFGEVNVRRVGNELQVDFTVLMAPQGGDAEGWQTGVALDASTSMQESFGRMLEGEVPPQVVRDYVKKRWIDEVVRDGRTLQVYQQPAFEDAIRRGYLTYTKNIIEPLAREFIGYLAGNLDADGGTTVIYWACGDGSATEVLGDVTAEQCKKLKIGGPEEIGFGHRTCLLPAMNYFVDRFADAARGMYVFLTDGRLDDLPQVKAYTTQLAKAIEAGRRNSVKCVLIGIGTEVDESQMEQLDDLDTGTSVDIWDHKIATEMRELTEIFAEVVDENQIVVPTARILDASGRVVKSFLDGMPAKVTFSMPASSGFFVLDLVGETIQQTVIG